MDAKCYGFTDICIKKMIDYMTLCQNIITKSCPQLLYNLVSTLFSYNFQVSISVYSSLISGQTFSNLKLGMQSLKEFTLVYSLLNLLNLYMHAN